MSDNNKQETATVDLQEKTDKKADKIEVPEPEVMERYGSQEDLATLYSKLSKATGELINVEKNGHNDYYNYKYAKADDIYLEVSKVLSKYNIAVLTHPVSRKVNKYKNNKGNIVIELLLEKHFSFNCGDTGAHIGMKYWGYDRGQGDKFLYKAYTGAMKYFLRDNFMIDTGDPDDPEFGKHSNVDANIINDKPNKNKSNKNKKKKKTKENKKKNKDNKPSNNYEKILELYKDEECRSIVKDAVQEFLVMMNNEDKTKDEVKFKNVKNYSDKQLKYILDEIEERKE